MAMIDSYLHKLRKELLAMKPGKEHEVGLMFYHIFIVHACILHILECRTKYTYYHDDDDELLLLSVDYITCIKINLSSQRLLVSSQVAQLS